MKRGVERSERSQTRCFPVLRTHPPTLQFVITREAYLHLRVQRFYWVFITLARLIESWTTRSNFIYRALFYQEVRLMACGSEPSL